jgi:hypothetical protein
MTTIFPNNNLPTSSQQWGREVQKRIESIESEVSRQKINTNSADSQLQASYKRLDETVKEIGLLSTSNANYKVNASNISGGTYSSGKKFDARIEIPPTDGEIDFYASYFPSTSGEAEIINGTIAPTTFLVLGGPNPGFYRNLNITGYTDIVLSSTNGNVILNKFSSDGLGTTGASINSVGALVRTTSSERYKQDISNLQVNYDELLSLEPKRFRLKDEVSTDKNARYYAGFIAEELAETSLTDFVSYSKDENGDKIPDGIHYAELSAALLSAIKHQDELIKSLSARIETLENKDKV